MMPSNWSKKSIKIQKIEYEPQKVCDPCCKLKISSLSQGFLKKQGKIKFEEHLNVILGFNAKN